MCGQVGVRPRIHSIILMFRGSDSGRVVQVDTDSDPAKNIVMDGSVDKYTFAEKLTFSGSFRREGTSLQSPHMLFADPHLPLPPLYHS